MFNQHRVSQQKTEIKAVTLSSVPLRLMKSGDWDMFLRMYLSSTSVFAVSSTQKAYFHLSSFVVTGLFSLEGSLLWFSPAQTAHLLQAFALMLCSWWGFPDHFIENYSPIFPPFFVPPLLYFSLQHLSWDDIIYISIIYLFLVCLLGRNICVFCLGHTTAPTMPGTRWGLITIELTH